jgi:hypothetical protein
MIFTEALQGEGFEHINILDVIPYTTRSFVSGETEVNSDKLQAGTTTGLL